MIYIVTSGTYSDYGIRGVYLSRDKADAFVAALSSDNYHSDARVEEWEEGPNPDELSWDVVGYVYSCNPALSTTVHLQEEKTELNHVRTWDGCDRTGYGVVVRTETAQAAHKIGMEMIQRFRAQETPSA